MNTFDPDALAECGDSESDQRPTVQPVTASMIRAHVIEHNMLPPHSAVPFAAWLADAWGDLNEDGDKTNGQVLGGALADWRGNK